MPQFKYLFKAFFRDKDGKTELIEQNQEDKSPFTEGKNCFYEVLKRIDNLVDFCVINQETGAEHLLHLPDLHFEINHPPFEPQNCSAFKLHNDEAILNPRLIWFLRRELKLNVMNTTITENVIKSYNFGFQANTKSGENREFIISLE